MIKIVVIIGFFLVLWFFKKPISKIIVNIIKKNRKIKTVENENAPVVFAPNGTVRTFSISFDIVEKGDGTVQILLAKK